MVKQKGIGDGNDEDNIKLAMKIKDIIEKECKAIKYIFPKEYETEIELAWKPIINRNGYLIGKEQIEQALNSDRIKELLKTNQFGIEFPYDMSMNMISQCTLYMDKKVGYIKSIDLDKGTVIVCIREDIISKEYINDYLLAFNYMGELEKIHSDDKSYRKVNNLKIMKCGLIGKETSCYQ